VTHTPNPQYLPPAKSSREYEADIAELKAALGRIVRKLAEPGATIERVGGFVQINQPSGGGYLIPVPPEDPL